MLMVNLAPIYFVISEFLKVFLNIVAKNLSKILLFYISLWTSRVT